MLCYQEPFRNDGFNRTSERLDYQQTSRKNNLHGLSKAGNVFVLFIRKLEIRQLESRYIE